MQHDFRLSHANVLDDPNCDGPNEHGGIDDLLFESDLQSRAP